MRYANDPPNLILPTERTIRHIAAREGLGELSDLEWDFIWDLLAKAGGAQVAEFDEDEAIMEAATHAIIEAQAFADRHGIGNQDYYARIFERDFHRMQHQLHSVLDQLDLNEIPGYNHATKAVRVLRLLRQIELRWALMEIGLRAVGTFLKAIQAAIEQVENLTPTDIAYLQKFASAFSNEPGTDAEFLGIELQVQGMDLGEILRIARHLDQISELQRGRSKPMADPDGEDIAWRGITDLSELPRIPQADFALPPNLLKAKAAMGDLSTRAPHTRRAKKQLLFLVIDGSGSMLDSGATSASRAAGVALNRLWAVIEGDAEVYVRFFDGTLRQKEYHAFDAASAHELMQIVTSPLQYRGGTTEFNSTLRASAERVQALMNEGQLREPELVLVTDGKANVPGISALQGVKMHVVQVGPEEVTELSDLARQSGGVSVYTGLMETA